MLDLTRLGYTWLDQISSLVRQWSGTIRNWPCAVLFPELYTVHSIWYRMCDKTTATTTGIVADKRAKFAMFSTITAKELYYACPWCVKQTHTEIEKQNIFRHFCNMQGGGRQRGGVLPILTDYTLLERFWRILLYLTDNAIAMLYVTYSFINQREMVENFVTSS